MSECLRAFGNFIWREILFMCGDCPDMAERVLISTRPIAVKLIDYGPQFFGACSHSLLREGVHVLDVYIQSNGCVTERFGPFITLRRRALRFVTQHDA